MKYLNLLFLFMFIACAPKPTKTGTDNAVQPLKNLGKNAAKIEAATAILDVRPPFEFNLSHIPGSINVAWEDFSRQSPEYRGLLVKDLHPLSRRLALIGIDPQTPVLIVGKGLLGGGEEGRLAWTLESLGIENVQLAPVSSFREKREENPPRPNKSFWTPVLNSSLEVSWNELRQKIEGVSYPPSRARRKALSSVPLPLKDENFVVLDVRPEEEVSLDNLTKRTPRAFRFENISWKEFFTEELDPNPLVMKRLNESNISQQTEIMVISNHGVRSGAVTWVLQKLGYKKARNFAGGYEQVRFKK
jgi:thiosulfate/3-mercaptopyruvate sulfurtransferase